MLCMICTGMLRGGTGQQWTGTHDLTFQHHSRTETLRRSRQAGCSICTALANDLRDEIDLLDDQDISVAARLSEVDTLGSAQAVFRLEFVLRDNQIHTFVLIDTDSQRRKDRTGPKNALQNYNRLRTSKSDDTASDEVFELANQWIKDCNSNCQCVKLHPVARSKDKGQERDEAEDAASKEEQQWLPKRLVDLRKIKESNGVQLKEASTYQSRISNPAREKIKLVEPRTDPDFNRRTIRYVTLSHCWGKPRSSGVQLKLTHRNEARFKNVGIELLELPKTFRDAILLASRLDGVEYIWIDSLCIKQRLADRRFHDKESEEDWLEQSREMDQVYAQAYLNLSATAAVDSDQGLFHRRRPEELWEDEINLNVTGLITLDEQKEQQKEEHEHKPSPRDKLATAVHTVIADQIRRSTTESLFGFPRSNVKSGDDCLLRCVIIDITFWECLVDNAPVNRRAWVLQERLMAPRVLHFCRNQIAWECAGFQDAEAYPKALPPLTMRYGDIFEEGRLKSLEPGTGLRLREMRLKGFKDPDQNLADLGAYELWKRIVEMYSRTSLSVSGDKLVALSGVAKHFRDTHFKKSENCKYVAGMWRTHLESQLLWHVNEVFRDGTFDLSAERAPLRAPSFSWAAIDAPHGVIYGEVTNYKDDVLFVDIGENAYSCALYDEENEFGMLEEGLGVLKLTPKYLHEIELERLQPPHRVPYCWNLKSNKKAKHTNVYLDAPLTDVDIFEPSAELFCMPVAYGERTVKKSSRDLICLLLMKLEKKSRGYMRIGLTKLSKFRDYAAQEQLVGKGATEHTGWIKIY